MGHYQWLEILWRLGSRGPWHFVGAYLCADDRRAVISFIEDVGPVQLVGD